MCDGPNVMLFIRIIHEKWWKICFILYIAKNVLQLPITKSNPTGYPGTTTIFLQSEIKFRSTHKTAPFFLYNIVKTATHSLSAGFYLAPGTPFSPLKKSKTIQPTRTRLHVPAESCTEPLLISRVFSYFFILFFIHFFFCE